MSAGFEPKQCISRAHVLNHTLVRSYNGETSRWELLSPSGNPFLLLGFKTSIWYSFLDK